VRDLHPKQAWSLLILAVLVNLILFGVLVSLFGLTSGPSEEPDASMTVEEDLDVEDPPFIETNTPTGTPTPTIEVVETPIPSPAIAVPSPLPSPTRRGYVEPTRPPYVFPTPIQIAPLPRDRSTPTPAVTLTRPR
jgi:hypothetical protein